MTGRPRCLLAVLFVFAACRVGDPPLEETKTDISTGPAAVEDPHAGHAMDSAAAGEHAGHDMDPVAADAHAAHEMNSATADPHAGHRTPTNVLGRSAQADHAGHEPTHPQRSTQMPAMMGVDSGHAKLMALVRELLSDSAVARRVREDSALRRLWGDSAVRQHVLGREHSH